MIPMPTDSTRVERSKQAAATKEAVAELSESPSHFSRWFEPLKGTNNSRQYNAVIGYAPLIGQQKETIKIEIGFARTIAASHSHGQARTILLDPNTASR